MYDYNSVTDDIKDLVGAHVDIAGKNMEELVESYEKLLIGVYLLNKPDEAIRNDGSNGYCKMLDWLRTTDFYTCPASTRYHEAYPSGLLVHSLRVYNIAVSLTATPEFANTDLKSAPLAALVHDWCKIGLYEVYHRNVKDEKTGQWTKQAAYKYNQKGIPLGHGATSMFLAQKFFHLSAEEALAIRWHQGRWNVCDAEVNEFQLANEKYPLVHLLQFADQLSITDYCTALDAEQETTR